MKGISIIVFLFALASLAILMNASANWLEMQPTSLEERFAVVDTYMGCSVVRYNLNKKDIIFMGYKYENE